MPTVQLEAEVSTEELLRALTRMPGPELDAFLERALLVRAQRVAPHLERDEAALLEGISRAIPADFQRRFDELVARRDAEALTEEEHVILLELTDEIERREASRVEAFAELAHLRGIGLDALMVDLGLEPVRAG